MALEGWGRDNSKFALVVNGSDEKGVGMTLEETVANIREKVRAGSFPNEYAVSLSSVAPLLGSLGWPTNDPLVVYPQYKVGGLFVDFALCHPLGRKALVFIEVKKVGGLSPKGQEQLFNYAYSQGVPLLVFTDGNQWDFYLAPGQGNFEERKIYSLDLLNDEMLESCARLIRYLSQNNVLSGIASRNAWEDHQREIKRQQIEQTLPLAWNQLLVDADPSVVDALLRKVLDICGSEPDRQQCAAFLAALSKSTGGVSEKLPTYSNSIPAPEPIIAPLVEPQPIRSDKLETDDSARSPLPLHVGRLGFVLRDEWYPYRSAWRVMVGIFEKLAELDPTFPDRFYQRDTRKNRKYIAKEKRGLYERADLCEKYYAESNFGWFVGTNYGRKDIERATRLECEVAGLQFGTDLVLHLDKD